MSDGLTELMDAEVFVEGADHPSAEQRLLKSLEGTKGVEEMTLVQGRLAVRYDPVSITKIDIVKRVESAGFKVKEVESAAASPVTDDVPVVDPATAV